MPEIKLKIKKDKIKSEEKKNLRLTGPGTGVILLSPSDLIIIIAIFCCSILQQLFLSFLLSTLLFDCLHSLFHLLSPPRPDSTTSLIHSTKIYTPVLACPSFLPFTSLIHAILRTLLPYLLHNSSITILLLLRLLLSLSFGPLSSSAALYLLQKGKTCLSHFFPSSCWLSHLRRLRSVSQSGEHSSSNAAVFYQLSFYILLPLLFSFLLASFLLLSRPSESSQRSLV